MKKIKYITPSDDHLIVPLFKGRTIDNMPELVSHGYRPISGAEIMEQRIIAENLSNQDLIKHWKKDHLDSGDSIIYNPNGNIKIVYDSKTLLNANPNSDLGWHGSLVLESGTYKNASGVEFKKKEIEKYAGKYLTLDEVIKNPIWLALARGDKYLLREYAKLTNSRVNDSTFMKIWIDKDELPTFEAESLWCFYSPLIGSNVQGSNIGLIDCNNGRLIGIPENFELVNSFDLHSKKDKLELLLLESSKAGLVEPGNISKVKKLFKKYLK